MSKKTSSSIYGNQIIIIRVILKLIRNLNFGGVHTFPSCWKSMRGPINCWPETLLIQSEPLVGFFSVLKSNKIWATYLINKTQGPQLPTVTDRKINPLMNHFNTRGTCSDKTYYYNILNSVQRGYIPNFIFIAPILT